MPEKKDYDKHHETIKEEVLKLQSVLKEESKIKKLLKRASVVIIALFLLLLILAYFVPSYDLFIIIPAQFDSYEIKGNVISLKNSQKIIFENGSYNDLLEVYYENQQHEFKACLTGAKDSNDYIVKGIKIPRIISQDFSSVTAEPCDADAIISLHSHPYRSCYLSVHDVSTYRIVKEINKDAIMGIMCEAKRFNFYGFE